MRGRRHSRSRVGTNYSTDTGRTVAMKLFQTYDFISRSKPREPASCSYSIRVSFLSFKNRKCFYMIITVINMLNL